MDLYQSSCISVSIALVAYFGIDHWEELEESAGCLFIFLARSILKLSLKYCQELLPQFSERLRWRRWMRRGRLSMRTKVTVNFCCSTRAIIRRAHYDTGAESGFQDIAFNVHGPFTATGSQLPVPLGDSFSERLQCTLLTRMEWSDGWIT